MATLEESDSMNRNPYVPPEDLADYLKTSVVNEAPKAPAPAARKPAPKPAHKAQAKKRK